MKAEIFLFLFLLSLTSLAQPAPGGKPKEDDLSKGFLTPPNSAKPLVWWHWMDGNISKDGIAKDLAWMKRAGIGGFQTFDIGMPTPQLVKHRLVYMTPEWKDAFRFATKLADSLKLQMGVSSAPGWGESGGPWVPAADGMKKLVWSETHAQGGRPFTGLLPKPPSVTGVFQNSPHLDGFRLEGTKAPPEYGRDVAVIAYKLPDADVPLSELKPRITSSAGHFTLTQLTDGDLATTSLLPSDTVSGYAWIQFEFESPRTFKAITIAGGGERGPLGIYGLMNENRSLEASDDGRRFHRVCYIPAGRVLQQTIEIPVTTARFFRITFKNPPALPDYGAIFGLGGKPPTVPAGTDVAEIVLHTALRVNRFEDKAGFAIATDLYTQPTPASDAVIAPKDVVDLTGRMNADGTLHWTPPPGNWNIVRFGYSLTGKENYPAALEATGLEVDKMDPAAVKAYFENYLDQYKSATGGLMGNKGGLQYMVTDSWEANVQNWTKNMPEEFFKRRGYSMLPWMPVLTGHIVKSSEESDHFLWDFRKTLGELVAGYHYGQLATLLHRRGMKLYSESHESGRALVADGMEIKRKADIPMAAMWMANESDDNYAFQSDIRESASVAHLYGQNLVAAESLTAFGNTWAYSPERLKPTADLELASGLNRFVIHTSVHQPVDDKIPGLGLGPYGQWFTRHETWAEQAKAWTAYLARSSYMLQQGRFVADVLYYYGEDNNITALFGRKLPDVPGGYNFDFVNADALLHLISVKDKQIVTPCGMRYKILALDSNARQMTLKVAKKISELVSAGAIVIGPRPSGSPDLNDDTAAFARIVNDLWGRGNIAGNEKTVAGNGKVIAGKSIGEALAALKIDPDFDYTRPHGNTHLLYVHRKLPGKEIYWVNNRSSQVENVEATFRVAGKNVEIWHPETGKIEQASYAYAHGRTKVPLRLEPNDAVFVVFTGKAVRTSRLLPEPVETELTVLDGPWKLHFQKDRGAPDEISIDTLASWTDNTNAGVKYFSGTGTYSKTIDVPASWCSKEHAQLWLDLGDVKNLAEVIINGRSMGIVWKRPFRVNITGNLKAGANTLVIKVTNLWVNRLIGDTQPGGGKKYTYTAMQFYQAGSALLPSGLLGPVRLLEVEKGGAAAQRHPGNNQLPIHDQ